MTDETRPVTLRTIAQRASVHPSTVSRALNPVQAGRVNARTVERIRRLASELEYEPHPWARSLRTNRTMTIGLVLPRLADGTLAVIFEGSEELARRNGYQAMTVSTRDDPEGERRVINHLIERRADGLILATASQEDPVIDQLAARGVPFVLLNRASGDHLGVRGDDHGGGYQATKHLIDRGHQRIGMISGPRQFSTAALRHAGYVQAHLDVGLPLDRDLVQVASFALESGVAATRALLGLAQRPTAILAANDYVAVAAMSVAREAGLRVPQDLAMVGYNDVPLASMLPIPLSSVSVPLLEMGRQAVELLLRRLAGESVESIVLPVTLVERESSG
jgi:LacI family transcriptional regulator